MTALLRTPRQATTTRPRLGFLGVGWIGRHRMQAILASGVAEAAAIADPSPEMAAVAARLAPRARAASSLDDLLDIGVDGVVIATPSALHAAQARQALARGVAVFCQKPLGRTAAEVEAVVEAARSANRLLDLDLSYRTTAAMERIRGLVAEGAIGRVHGVDLVFHNAYGPDKPWFYDPELAGGGCVMNLGIHLVDLALWTLGFPEVTGVASRLYAGGAPLGPDPEGAEDSAVAMLDLACGATVRLGCSWRLHLGRDAEIAGAFHGTDGGVAFRNVDGSFYDFVAERYRGTRAEVLAAPPDDWGGRAAVAWARRLAVDRGFDPAAERFVDVARTLDRIYGR